MRRCHAQDNRKNIDGLTTRERLILEEWDAGLSIERIARKHGFTTKQIHSTASQYLGLDERRSFERDCRDGSAALLAAMVASKQSAAVP